AGGRAVCGGGPPELSGCMVGGRGCAGASLWLPIGYFVELGAGPKAGVPLLRAAPFGASRVGDHLPQRAPGGRGRTGRRSWPGGRRSKRRSLGGRLVSRGGRAVTRGGACRSAARSYHGAPLPAASAERTDPP